MRLTGAFRWRGRIKKVIDAFVFFYVQVMPSPAGGEVKFPNPVPMIVHSGEPFYLRDDRREKFLHRVSPDSYDAVKDVDLEEGFELIILMRKSILSSLQYDG